MKKILIALLQLAVTAAVLYLVFHDPNKRAQMALALRLADYRWIAAAISFYVLVELAAAARWQILLKVQGINLSIARMTGLFFIGMFFNQFLPGGTGGDIIKSYYLLKETPTRKAGALLAVLFDRLIGFFAVMPIERTISAIPISFAGEGPREHVLQIMLNGLCGVASGVAALIGTMSFLVILFCSVPGAIVYFFYKPSGVIKHVKLREMREELAVLGHEISETE